MIQTLLRTSAAAAACAVFAGCAGMPHALPSLGNTQQAQAPGNCASKVMIGPHVAINPQPGEQDWLNGWRVIPGQEGALRAYSPTQACPLNFSSPPITLVWEINSALRTQDLRECAKLGQAAALHPECATPRLPGLVAFWNMGARGSNRSQIIDADVVCTISSAAPTGVQAPRSGAINNYVFASCTLGNRAYSYGPVTYTVKNSNGNYRMTN